MLNQPHGNFLSGNNEKLRNDQQKILPINLDQDKESGMEKRSLMKPKQANSFKVTEGTNLQTKNSNNYLGDNMETLLQNFRPINTGFKLPKPNALNCSNEINPQ